MHYKFHVVQQQLLIYRNCNQLDYVFWEPDQDTLTGRTKVPPICITGSSSAYSPMTSLLLINGSLSFCALMQGRAADAPPAATAGDGDPQNAAPLGVSLVCSW